GTTDTGITVEFSGTSGNRIEGNWIGTDSTGATTVANANDGVVFRSGATGNTLGGLAAGAGNVVTGSGQYGVVIRDPGTRTNAVLQNAIYGNRGIGLTLNFDVVTANNGTKSVSLPNDDMDYPVFASAFLAAGSLTVAGYVGTAPGQATFGGARIEVFRSDN